MSASTTSTQKEQLLIPTQNTMASSSIRLSS
jgi:hypothetical protein